MKSNAYGSYLKQEIEGSSQGKIILMLYDASIRFMRAAIRAIEDKNIEEAHNNLIKAQNIFYELMSVLNTEEGGEIAESLLKLYDFIVWELIHANTTKGTEKIENVIRLLMPIRTAWKEAIEKEEGPKQPPQGETKPINIAG